MGQTERQTAAGPEQASFKDYFLVMQLHPEADAAMIDMAYWHLARRYQAAVPDEPSAKERLEELNEAYAVLGFAERRRAYLAERTAVLGDQALPLSPAPAVDPPPPAILRVLDRQRPRPREPGRPHGLGLARAVPGVAQLAGAAFFVVALTVAALVASAPLVFIAATLSAALALFALPWLVRSRMTAMRSPPSDKIIDRVSVFARRSSVPPAPATDPSDESSRAA